MSLITFSNVSRKQLIKGNLVNKFFFSLAIYIFLRGVPKTKKSLATGTTYLIATSKVSNKGDRRQVFELTWIKLVFKGKQHTYFMQKNN